MHVYRFEELDGTVPGGYAHSFHLPLDSSTSYDYDHIRRQCIALDAFRWCQDQFGTDTGYGKLWIFDVTNYLCSFRDPVDAAAFKLRWC